MGDFYWILEYGKVLLAYLFLMFVYPSVIFRSYLKGKSRTFWFGFCLCSQIVLVSSVVLLLGVAHILNPWVVRGLFYGSLLLSVARPVRMRMTPRYFIYKVKNHTYGGKLLLAVCWENFCGFLKKCLRAFWQFIRSNVIEVVVFCLLVGYGMLYFAWCPLQIHGYGYSDIIVHHYWIYGLQEGKIFAAGIYPEAMHCIAYSMKTLFGIQLYNVILFLQCINVMAFLGSLYLFAREVLGWKGSALVGLAVFLTMRTDNAGIEYLLSRLQTSLPQEFALFAVFLIPTFLIRYIRHAGCATFRGKKTKFFWDENLLVFMLGISVTLSTHFYPTIMAFATCMGVVVIWFFRIFNWRRFVPLAVASILALVISFTPMMLAFAEGIGFQGSIYWALGVMSDAQKEDAEEAEEGQEEAEEEFTLETLPDGRLVVNAEDAANFSNSTSGAPAVVQPEIVKPVELTLRQRVGALWDRVYNRIMMNWYGIYNAGYRASFNMEWSDGFVALSKVIFTVWAAYHVLAVILRPIFRKWKKWTFCTEIFDGYAILAAVTIMILVLRSAGATDFPVLLATDRLGSIIQASFMVLLVVPFDFAAALVCRLIGRKVMQFLAIPAVAAAIALIVTSGNYHTFLYVRMSRHNGAVDITNSIISSVPEKQFTVVATTDELYQVRDHGFHEELLTFVRSCDKDEYYIPTRYLFFYVEKKPVWYDMNHYCVGPAWLAQDKQVPNTGHGTDVVCGEVSDELADDNVSIGNKPSSAYSNFHNRQVVESKITRYLREFLAEHPNEFKVYYEDDYITCYFVEQNPDRLINFGRRKA